MPTDERRQREVLNRLRTHIICYIIDRSFCLNLGKPFMIPEDEVYDTHFSTQMATNQVF